MPIMNWDEAYSVGVERIDTEHRKLIDMINSAHDTAETENDTAALAGLVTDMIEYATIHFSTEAWLMKEHGFPGATEHMKAHQTFTDKVVTRDGTASIDWGNDPIPVFQFLADWLKHHIMETDKELGQFLNDRGVR